MADKNQQVPQTVINPNEATPIETAAIETAGDEGQSISYDGQESPFEKIYKQDYNLSSVKLPRELALLNQRPTLFPAESRPVELGKPVEGAGFIKSAMHAFAENNELIAGANYLYDHFNEYNPYADETAPNWTPYQVNNYVGIPEKYWPLIGTARTEKDLQNIRTNIMHRMEVDEQYENGSMAGKLIGGGFGYALGPSSLIPMVGVLKYGKPSEYVLKNMMRMAPGMTAQAAVHNGIMESMKANPNLEQYAVDTFRDAVTGTVFAGLGLTAIEAMEAHRVNNARKMINLNYDGITPHVEIDAKGMRTGRLIAVPEKGESVSAAKVSMAQEFLDTELAREGLFAIPNIERYTPLRWLPQVRALTNRFPSARAFLGRVSDHSLITEGVKAGRERPNNFSETLNYYRAETTSFLDQMQGYWHEANGTAGTTRMGQNIKALAQRFNKSRAYQWDEFGKAVINVLITGEKHENKSINTAADALKGHLENTYRRFREAHDITEDWMDPRTSYNYVMRSYNHEALMLNEPEWNSVISSEFKKQDELIQKTMLPIESANTRIKELKAARKQLSATKDKAEIERLNRSILFTERERDAYQNSLHDKILEDSNLRILADDPTALTHTESETLKEMHAERVKLENEVEALKQELKKVGRTAEEKAKKKEFEEKIRETEKMLQDEVDRLYEMAHSGKVSRRLYNKNHEENTIEYKDPDIKLKLREPFADDAARLAAAQNVREKILNLRPEDLTEMILHQTTGADFGIPVKQRTFMVNDEVLYRNHFMHTDLSHLVNAYDNFLNKRTALKETYANTSIEGGIKPLIAGVAEEARIQRQKASQIKDKKKRERELKQIDKDFKITIKDMEKTYNTMMGRTAKSDIERDFARAAVNYTAASRLGATPLTMIVEPAAIIMQQGLWPTIHSGLVPALKSLNGVLKTKAGRDLNEVAGSALMAIEHYNSHAASKIMRQDSIVDIPGSGQIADLAAKAAYHTATLTGVNRFENTLQKITAKIADSEIMRMMHRFKEGKLKPKEKERLLMSGLDPEKWADRFIKGFEEAGADKNGLGGYNSHYYYWGDIEAANKMARALKRQVRATILKRDIQSAPLALNDPIYGLLSLFKGWGFEALNRYTLPMMQRPDGQKLFGMMLMLSMGALVDPLRRIARGENAWEEGTTSKQMFWSALVNSGVLGVLTDGVENLNVMSSGRLLKNYQSDKYRERGFAGAFLGPAAGMADDLGRVLTMLARRDYNENDIKKAARLFPYTNIWQLRGLVNKAIESWGLPKTMREAQDLKE